MEWDNVEVCDDLIALALFNICSIDIQSPGFTWAYDRPPGETARFGFKEFGDDLNLWYVALTRAKRRLSLPPKFQDLVEAFGKIREFANAGRRLSAGGDGLSQPGCEPDSPARSTDKVTIESTGAQHKSFSRLHAQIITQDLNLELSPAGKPSSPFANILRVMRQWEAAGCGWGARDEESAALAEKRARAGAEQDSGPPAKVSRCASLA